MDAMFTIGASGIVGLGVGFLLSKALTKIASQKESGTTSDASGSDVEWWKVRETLTGTQLQILQHLEAKKSATITQLQKKFSFIPDRELYYRLEQIVLMQFVRRGRKDSDVVYELNEYYSATVEDDKTVMLAGD
ncbi:MAG: hypothetical protein ACJAYE_000660 [Candidatus Azotimanducaceae bacterium]|jgi:hypothetical protein